MEIAFISYPKILFLKSAMNAFPQETSNHEFYHCNSLAAKLNSNIIHFLCYNASINTFLNDID